MNVKRIVLILSVSFLALPLRGQETEVQRYLGMVQKGQVDEVRKEVPGLLEKYPNNPAVLYLQAAVTKEGAEAARIYQSIVDNFPKSSYADAALFRVYQFYYALGLYRTAELKMKQLQREYPHSRYLKPEANETASIPEEPPPPTGRAPRDSAGGTVPREAAPAVATPEATPSVTPTTFALQVGAFGAQPNAEKQKKFFEEKGFTVDMITKVRDTQTLYVVLVGNYASYDEAKAKSVEIKNKYQITSLVVPR
jgi:cell division protein FtsN